MKKELIYIVLFLALISCDKVEKSNNDKINSAAWLIGKWENNSDNGQLSENWEKVNDTTFSGTSFYIKSNDTLHNESIILQQSNDDLLYIATVKGQNKDLPITFKLTQATEKQLVFENPTHDYPQKIVYRQISKDSLIAEIAGKQQGKVSSEHYPMKKK